MKFGVVIFPGSNCDHDCYYSIQSVTGKPVEFIWQPDTSVKGFDAVVLPGGFSYGDYLRTGALAKFSPVMQAVKSFADQGGLVIGICNGFQILTEAGLLPGALLRNSNMKYICKFLKLRTATTDTPFTNQLTAGQILNVPIGHGEGNFFADEATLKQLEDNDQIVFRYEENPNGSLHDIAGIVNSKRNVMGMMPHPERAADPLMGSTDGLTVLTSIVRSAAAVRA